MRDICIRNECTGCAACVQICPRNCIKMEENEDGFLYPIINEKLCINCKCCFNVCPNNKDIDKNTSTFYMGWHKSIDVLRKSSSGGAFTALADYMLKNNGVVYGASFDRNTKRVCHIAIESVAQLDELRLSKYYQSDIKTCYIDVKENLKTRKVLFSGTACQIAGLYSFLGKDDEKLRNLITVDVLCHGVTNANVIDCYIKCKEEKYKKRIVDFRFRLKPNDSDWMLGGGTRVRLDFQDGSSIIEDKRNDTFFVGFNSYLFLRESCYHCKYVGTKRIADFTLADYWGVPINEISEQQRKFGVSLILVNSEKAKKMIGILSDEMEIRQIDSQIAISNNQALRKPSTHNPKRKDFFAKLSYSNFDYLIYKYNLKYYIKLKFCFLLFRLLGKNMSQRIISFIKRYLMNNEGSQKLMT